MNNYNFDPMDPKLQALVDQKLGVTGLGDIPGMSMPVTDSYDSEDMGMETPPDMPPEQGDELERLQASLMERLKNREADQETYKASRAKAMEDAGPSGLQQGLGMFGAAMQGMATSGKDLSMAGDLKKSWDADRKRAGDAIVDPSRGTREQLNDLIKMKALERADKAPGLQKDRDARKQKLADTKLAEQRAYDEKQAEKNRRFADEKNSLKATKAQEKIKEQRAYTEGINKEKREYQAKNKPATESQAKAAIFGRGMLEAEAKLAKVDFDPTEVSSQWGETAQDIPLIGGLVRKMRTDEGVAYTDYKRAWIGAKLRPESGAAIAPHEYESEDRKFFPQPGDTPEIIENKKQQRRSFTDQMVKNAGSALDPSYSKRVTEIYGPDKYASKDAPEQTESSFPRKIRKDGKIAVVQDESELQQANSEGWR